MQLHFIVLFLNVSAMYYTRRKKVILYTSNRSDYSYIFREWNSEFEEEEQNAIIYDSERIQPRRTILASKLAILN